MDASEDSRMLKPLIRFIISAGLGLDHGTKPGLARLCFSLFPNFRKVEQRTVIKVANKDYANLKKELHSTFASLSHKVALACDVWRNEDCTDYIRITVHWIDSDWVMQRRIINFKVLEPPISASIISDPVKESLYAWGLKGKVLSVTLDDVCDYDNVVEDLNNVMRPSLNGKGIRVRCVCRALSSCIKDGLDSVSEHLDKIRVGIQLPSHNPKQFIKLCVKYGLVLKYTMFDEVDWWDSTRTMLKRCMPFKDVLAEFIASNWPDDESLAISIQDWEVASVFCRFLDVFYEAVDYVSRNYYPSSSGLLLHLVNIAKLFSEYKGSRFQDKISAMEEKFLKNFYKIPDLYCLAAVMDPRIKLSGCECLLESFYNCTNSTKVNMEVEKIELSKLVREMFNRYASEPSGTQQTTSCKASASSTASTFAWSLASQKKGSAIDELAYYLQADHHFNKLKMEDFDILNWWKDNEVIYPLLSTMARDLLSTPLSTLTPDCAFHFNEEKAITDKSYQYSGKILEMCTCLKDWLNAQRRRQGKREEVDNEENTCAFEDLAIISPDEFVPPSLQFHRLVGAPVTVLPKFFKRPRDHFPSFSH